MQRASQRALRTNKKKPTGSRRTARGSKASSASGMGYAPVAMSMAVTSQAVPKVQTSGTVTRISHSEYFASVESAGAPFVAASYSCNPGVASIFPWLSRVAQRYETYKFRELCFHYHTRAATSQVGTVGLVFDFDAQDPSPSSQMVALSYHDKSADSCWKEQRLRVDLALGDRLPTRYTRAGLPATPYDLKTLDLGNLHVFVDGVAASTNLGLLEVVYTVDLYTPQIQDGIGGLLANTGTLDATHLVGTVNTLDDQARMPFRVTSSSVLTFDQTFEGLVNFLVVGGAGLGADFAPVASASGTAAIVSQVVNAATTNLFGAFRVRAVPGTTLTPTVTAAGGVTQVNYYVSTASYLGLGA